jgi:flagellar M-ring protein FliF
VDELKPSDVTIVDADSNESLGQNGSPDGGDGLEQELTRRLMSTLSPVVGSDRIRATVNVEYETGSSEESQEKYDPAVTATLSAQHSEEATGAGALAGGVPGTSSNVPSAKAGKTTTTTKDNGQFSKTDNNTYGVNKSVRHVIQPAGGIRRLTAAVVLDDAIMRKKVNGKWVEEVHKRQPEELKVISDLAQAAIGFNSDRGDVISVQNVSFDRPAEDDAAPATLMDQARKNLSDYSAFVRYGVLLVLFVLVYFLTIRPIQKRVFASPKPLLAEPDAPLPANAELDVEIDSPAGLLQRSVTLKKQLAEFVRTEPDSSSTVVRAWLREEA